jgi:hypothetical protein
LRPRRQTIVVFLCSSKIYTFVTTLSAGSLENSISSYGHQIDLVHFSVEINLQYLIMKVFYQKILGTNKTSKWTVTNGPLPGDRFKYAYEAVTTLHYRIGPDNLALDH